MPTPTVAEKRAAIVELTAGKQYFWCTCGNSKKQPFCDGSHSGTSFTPQSFTADKDGSAFLCQCKATKKPPFCDGSHGRLP
ncbi:MAG: CDGSH iron-sulfur domain-containing protein [Kordiimonadaceae bacterium]|nr:CDGSH iron-sulfur domain-containing protein [Kordiimonadaceae bacterium]